MGHTSLTCTITTEHTEPTLSHLYTYTLQPATRDDHRCPNEEEVQPVLCIEMVSNDIYSANVLPTELKANTLHTLIHMYIVNLC